MSLRNKLGEEMKDLEHDPVLAYRLWTDPNETYRDLTLRPLIKPSEQALEMPSRKGVLGTLGFLAALLVVGFLAGFAIRGDAFASQRPLQLAKASMGPVSIPASLEGTDMRGKVVAMLGSQAPDELVSLDVATSGDMTALVRLHDTSPAGEDRLSVMAISQTGEFEEILRQGATPGGLAVARFNNNDLVVASANAGMLDIAGLDARGKQAWSREVVIADGHAAALQVVNTGLGIVIAGPSDRLDRVGVTYLGLDGSLLWQRSFAADAHAPNLMLEADAEGAVFVSMRNATSVQGEASHTLIRVDAEGQDTWRATIPVTATSRLSGLAPAGDASAYILTTGDVPSLTKYDSEGVVAWDVLVPQAKQYNDIHLLSNADSNAVIAVSYTLTQDRQDVWIEQRDTLGVVVGQSNLIVPGLSSVDALSEIGPGQYRIAGSILPERFEDADIYVKDFEFRTLTTPIERPALAAVALPETSASPVDVPVASIAETPSTDTPVPVSARVEPQQSVTVDAAPETAPVEPRVEVMDPPVTAVASQAPQEATTEAAVAVAPQAEEPVDESLNRAAMSGFVAPFEVASAEPAAPEGDSLENAPVTTVAEGETVVAQCRFSCLDHADAPTTFPMWRSVRASASDLSAGIPDQHAQTCQAAGGIADMQTKPTCQAY